MNRPTPIPLPAWLTAYAVGLLCYLPLVWLQAYSDGWRGDEIFTWRMVNRPWLEIIPATAEDVHPPLHYLILHAWLKLHPAYWMMQALNILWSAAALALACWLANRTAGPRAAWWTALGLATLPFWLHYTQDARMYPQGLCLLLLAIAGWAVLHERPWRGWLTFGLALLAAAYTHNFCVFAGAVIGCGVLLDLMARIRAGTDMPRRHFLPGLTGCGIVILGYLPWLPIVFKQSQNSQIDVVFRYVTIPDQLQGWLLDSYTLGILDAYQPFHWLAGILWLCLLPQAGCHRALRSEAAASTPPWWWPLWFGGLMLVLLFLLVGLGSGFMEIRRHGMLFVPPLVIATGCALAGLERRVRWGRGFAYGCVLLSGCHAAYTIGRYYDGPPPEMTAAIGGYAGPDTTMVMKAFTVAEMEYGVDLPRARPGDPDVIVALTPGKAFQRAFYLERFRSIIANAPDVRPLLETYWIRIVALRNAPPAIIQQLYDMNQPDAPPQRVGPVPLRDVQSGDAAASALLGGAWTQQYVHPYFNFATAARLVSDPTEIVLPPLRRGPGSCEALIMHFGMGGLDFPTTLTLANAGRTWRIACDVADGIVTLSRGSGAQADVAISGPAMRPLTGRENPQGLPDGTYLLWAGIATLDLPATGPLRIDIGGLQDELHIREGFFEREGLTPNEIRWTMRRFNAETPLPAGREFSRIVLSGILSEQVKRRTLRVSASTPEAGRISAVAELVGVSYARHEITLPTPLFGGVATLEFELDEGWSPARAGSGSDPRELGFYLDSIELN